MKNMIQKHTPEQLVYIVKCGGHYFDEAERRQLSGWLENFYQFRREYENRHFKTASAAAAQYFARKLRGDMPQIKKRFDGARAPDKKLIYGFLYEAVELALREALA